MQKRDSLLLNNLDNYAEPVGIWLAALQDTRRRTLEVLEGIESVWLDFVPEESDESIGTILYHLAAIEADWLYEEILQTSFPFEIETLLPHNVRDDAGKLTRVVDTMQNHLDRLSRVHNTLLDQLLSMTPDEFEKPRSLPQYDVSPIYVIHHLMQHEAEHRSQINWIGMKARLALGGKMPEEKKPT